jgi:hypothetical protein
LIPDANILRRTPLYWNLTRAGETDMAQLSKRVLNAAAFALLACQAVAGAALEFGAFH